MSSLGAPHVRFNEIMRPNRRPYELGPTEDADLVGMRLYGLGPFHRERKTASQIQKKSHFVIRKDDIIYNKLFAWKGTFGIVPEELDGMFVSDKFPTYEVDRTRVDLEYLRWYFRNAPLWEQARQMSIGSAALSKLTLNPPRFLDLTIPLPLLDVQKRISSAISYLIGRQAEAARICDTAGARFEACLLAVIERVFQSVEAKWPSRSLVDIVDSTRGISYGVVQTGAATEDGVPTLRAGDLQRFRVRVDGVKRIAPDLAARYRRTKLTGSEVLLRIRGGLGEVATCPPELSGGNVSREIAVIPVADLVLPEYVMFAIARPSSQAFLQRHTRGTSYVGINLSDVRKLQMPVPPRQCQADAIARLRHLMDRLGSAEQHYRVIQTDIRALVPAILDRAFNGELL